MATEGKAQLMPVMLGLERGDVPSKTQLVLSLLGVEERARLMLMMLGILVATEGTTQLMLMMLELSVTTSPAKPHWCFGLGQKVEPGYQILMMLGLFLAVEWKD